MVALVIGVALLTQRYATADWVYGTTKTYWFHSNTVSINLNSSAEALPDSCTVATANGTWTSKVDANTNYSADLNHPYPSGAGYGSVKLCGSADLTDASGHDHQFFDDGIDAPGSLAEDSFTADGATTYKDLPQTNSGNFDMSQTGAWEMSVWSGNATSYSDWFGDQTVLANDDKHFQVKTSCP